MADSEEKREGTPRQPPLHVSLCRALLEASYQVNTPAKVKNANVAVRVRVTVPGLLLILMVPYRYNSINSFRNCAIADGKICKHYCCPHTSYRAYKSINNKQRRATTIHRIEYNYNVIGSWVVD